MVDIQLPTAEIISEEKRRKKKIKITAKI